MNIPLRTPLARVGVATALTVALVATATAPASASPPGGHSTHSAETSNKITSESPEIKIAWATILTAVIAAGGGADYMGKEAAQRMYHAGLRNAEYQQIKWSMRAMVIGAIGPVFGGILLVSFENKFYSM